MVAPVTDAFDCRFCPVEATRLQRLGSRDPTMRLLDREVWRASRTPDGVATLRLKWDGGRLEAEAWGEGAGWMLQRAPRICGLEDRPTDLVPHEPWLQTIVREQEHVALGTAPILFDALVAYVLQQRVAFVDAAASWRRVVEHFDESAPGPGGLLLPPSPSQWRSLSAATLASYEVDGQRARILHEVALHPRKLGRLEQAGLSAARELLPKLRGIGPWTSGMVLGVGCGDPDAFVLGDVSMPSIVARAFTGKNRSDDREMVELLEPYRGQRFRVLRLLFAAGIRRERLGPRPPRNPIRR